LNFDLIAARAHSARPTGQKDLNPAVRPLRVVRVVDAGQRHSSVGNFWSAYRDLVIG